jgi:glycosyltransferase involved in cell wall biosynthesis
MVQSRPREVILPRKPRLSVDIVIPVFNEAAVVEQTYADLRTILDSLPQTFTIYFINDGSTDGTSDALARLARKDRTVRIIELSRNFGHQAALTAGLTASDGDVVITMDGDGQHPPELIPPMLDLIKQGYDIIQTQRMEATQSGALKQWSSAGFYQLLNLISGTQVLPGGADFRALSRQAVEGLKSMPEYHRFLRGMISWMGYYSVILPYHEQKRRAGRSKYSTGKMLRLAMDAIFSFSLVPLYIGLSMGGLMLCLALLEMVYVLSFWITGRTTNLAPGWSSLMFVILIVGGLLMVSLGFVAIYVGYIFQEVKRRPVYLKKNGEKDG